MNKVILLTVLVSAAYTEDSVFDLYGVTSLRANSIIGVSGGMGLYAYSDSTFGQGMIGMANVGYGGVKFDLGYAAWATPDGCRKDWINPYYFPLGLGLAAKGSVVVKWKDEMDRDGEHEVFTGFGNKTLYYGTSLDIQVIIPMLEFGYYRSFDFKDEVVTLSFGIGF